MHDPAAPRHAPLVLRAPSLGLPAVLLASAIASLAAPGSAGGAPPAVRPAAVSGSPGSSSPPTTTTAPEAKIAPWISGYLAHRALGAGGLRPEAEPERPVMALLPAAAGGGLGIDAERLQSLGVTILRRTPEVVLVRVDLDRLSRVAEDPAVGFVRPPVLPVARAATPAEAIGAETWHQVGSEGGGVKVGVVDIEYLGYEEVFGQIGLTDLHTWTPEGGGFGEDFGMHGTACTEILHGVAPRASFYLARSGYETFEADFGTALDWVVESGASVVSSSLGTVGWFHDDGTSPLARAVDRARDRGVLVCIAAGNDGGGGFWTGPFADADGDGFHEFVPGERGNPLRVPDFGYVSMTLTWDGGSPTAEDFDLHLFRSGSESPAVSSRVPQGGAQPALEAILFVTPKTAFFGFPAMPFPFVAAVVEPGDYEIRVQRVRSTGEHDIRLYVSGLDLEAEDPYFFPAHSSSGRSLSTPADARGALAVGAVDMPDWRQGRIARYSSRGPTSDGRLKPDIAGPSALESLAYAPDLFTGTSASTPVCAGAAAVVLGSRPEMTAEELEAYLLAHARDAGPPGPDTTFGAGLLRLPPPKEAGPSFERGDADADGRLDMTDAVYVLSALFRQGPQVPCQDAADVDDSGRLDIVDPILVLDYLFRDGQAPVDPLDGCGIDGTPDDLGCASFGPCD